MFHRHLDAAGLPQRRFHDLRHSCATLLLVQGVSPRVVMEVLGHSEVGMTLNTYSHVISAAAARGCGQDGGDLGSRPVARAVDGRCADRKTTAKSIPLA